MKNNTEYYMLGSSWDGVDKTEDFVKKGIWQSGFSDNKYSDSINSINVGDEIAIKSSYVKSKNLPFKNGTNKVSVMMIKAIGKVTKNLRDGKFLEIKYSEDFVPKEIYGFSYRRTVSKIQKDKWENEIDWIFNGKKQSHYYSYSNVFDNLQSASSLNQILYGPPGTGKTYNTINRALEIIDGKVPLDRKEAKKKFESLSSTGQIEFVTFHQSYGYEEFVEGIKANTLDGNISYDIEPGIFKKLCKKSEGNTLFSLGQIIGKYEIVGISSELLKLKRESGSIIPVPMYILNEVFDLIDKKIITTEDLNSKNAIEKMSTSTEKFIVNGYPNVFRDLAQYWLDNKEVNIENQKNHILIIDEINRGNISKIFGELITLIEPSKRIGADEEIRLRLPYSNDEFGVPSNLYIIGTMNTADRSIALMDTALRRRFEFVEMMPNYDVLEEKVGIVADVDISKLLQKINARVEYLYDRDHTIGHAYFIELNAESTLDELNAVMKNRIIPLLQEYFYDDWEKIKLVLNDGFISKKTLNANNIFENIDDAYIEEDKFLYSIKENFEKESYLRLCQNS